MQKPMRFGDFFTLTRLMLTVRGFRGQVDRARLFGLWAQGSKPSDAVRLIESEAV